MTEKEYPENLIKCFVACKKDNWENDGVYQKFRKQATVYLKSKADDSLEHSKLVVDLSRATMSQFRGVENVKETKVKKAKATKKLVSRKRQVSQLSGGDGIKAEEKGTQEVALQGEG